MRIALLLLIVLCGCAGQAAYEIEPIETNSGKIICCKATVHNTKDIDLVELDFETNPNGKTKLSVKEKGVKTNAAIAAENQSKLLDAVTAIIPKGK